MAEEKTESKYALKFARRRSADNGKENPMPRPFSFDYFPKHTPKFKPIQDITPMKHENWQTVLRFRNKDYAYPRPRKVKEVMIAYNHFNMNYAGWNR